MPGFPRLEGEVEADVAVLGGGIVGITTALMLQEDGQDVVLVEADRLGAGVSGHTTAKVSSQHGLKYASLRSKYGADAARTYGQANQVALEWMARRVKDDGIDCDFRRRPRVRLRAGRRVDRGDRGGGRGGSAGGPARRRWTIPLRCPTRSRPRSASTTRPSSTCASTWAR